MTEHNQKIFRRILKVLGIICVFLLGALMDPPVSVRFFWILAALTAGLTIGYLLGTGKEIKIWKGMKIQLVKDDKADSKKK